MHFVAGVRDEQERRRNGVSAGLRANSSEGLPRGYTTGMGFSLRQHTYYMIESSFRNTFLLIHPPKKLDLFPEYKPAELTFRGYQEIGASIRTMYIAILDY